MTTVEFDLKTFSRQMSEVKKAVRRELANGAQDVLDAFVTDQVVRRLSMPGPESLGARGGSLRRSLKSSKVSQRGNTIKGRVFIRGSLQNKKARTHIFGATITPTRAQYLTVPTRFALTGDRPRGTPRRRSARMWPNTFVRRTKAGKLIIFHRRGKGRRRNIVPLYVLRKQVKIPKRWPFFEDWNAFVQRGFGRSILRSAYSRALRAGRQIARDA